METFDFARPASLPASQVEAVHAALEGPTHRAGMLLGSRLRLPVGMALEGIEPAEADLVGTDRCLFSCSAQGESVVVSGLATFVCELADVVMGGPGTVAERPPSALERRLVAAHIGPAVRDVALAALPDLGVACVVEPWTADSAPSLDGAVAVHVQLTIGDVAGRLTLALPGGRLAASAPATPADAGIDLGAADSNPLMLDALSDVPVAVAVRFDPVRVAASDLDHLDVGDVIRLEHPTARPLVGVVDHQPLFLARPGRHGRHLAIRVEHVFDEVS